MTIELAEDQAETSDKGYDPGTVPLCGRHPIFPECCRCSDDATYPLVKDCGCAFGQCANGLIY